MMLMAYPSPSEPSILKMVSHPNMLLQLYKSSRFTSGGFRHYELYFPDGSCPSEAIVDRFLSIAESEKGVHPVPNPISLS